MPKLIILKIAIRVLLQHGFFFVSQNGSHAKYKKIGHPTCTVIVPIHGKEIPHGTMRSIMRQAGLQMEDFE